MKRCRKTMFPSAPPGFVRAVPDHPWAVTSGAYTLWSMFAQTSPMPAHVSDEQAISGRKRDGAYHEPQSESSSSSSEAGSSCFFGVDGLSEQVLANSRCVHSRRSRVRVGADASRVVDDELAQYEIDGCGAAKLEEPALHQTLESACAERIENLLGHGIRPTLAHAARLGGLQAASSSATSHTVGNAVRVLMDHEIIFDGTITFGLANDSAIRVTRDRTRWAYGGEIPQEHPHVTRLATALCQKFPSTNSKSDGRTRGESRSRRCRYLQGPARSP